MTNTVTETNGTQAAPAQAKQEQKSYLTPRVNIHEEKDGYVLHAEMPGVAKDGLEILLEDNELTIIGHRKAVSGVGEPLYRESTGRDYRRVFELDPVVDTNRIVAKIDQGLLTLELPKAEKVKPRRIQVS
ncbi:MAG TPA: Hsp20/alpha crystallin family protein [Verrucomicrobiae bacterium]